MPIDVPIIRIASAVVLAALFIFINKRMHRAELSFTLGLIWLLAVSTAFVFSIFPASLSGLAHELGVQVPANFLFFASQFFLVLLVFGLTLKSARQEKRLTRLAQELALLRLDAAESPYPTNVEQPTRLVANKR
jgi:hypothetical protein